MSKNSILWSSLLSCLGSNFLFRARTIAWARTGARSWVWWSYSLCFERSHVWYSATRFAKLTWTVFTVTRFGGQARNNFFSLMHTDCLAIFLERISAFFFRLRWVTIYCNRWRIFGNCLLSRGKALIESVWALRCMGYKRFWLSWCTVRCD